MRNAFKYVAVWSAALLWGSYGQATWAIELIPGPADNTGAARNVATARLQELRASGEWNGEQSLARASLSDPFYLFWTDASFAEFEKSESTNILAHIHNYCLSFPILVDGRQAGAINVRLKDGSYRVSSIQIGEGHYLQRIATQESLQLSTDERLSELITHFAGSFYVVENGSRIVKMAPINKAHGDAAVPVPIFAPESQVAPKFKERIRQAQAHRDKSDPTGELEAIPPSDD